MADRSDFEAASYQTAYVILGHLSADDVLHYLGQAAGKALPYRPAWHEIVVAAALLAGQDAVDPSVNAEDKPWGGPF